MSHAVDLDLSHFATAQAGIYAQALAELRAGRKTSHWMWFVFPQLTGLGTSAMAHRYALASTAEARAYLAHPLLGARLRACTDAVLLHGDQRADAILGQVDAIKLRSSMTLFELVGDPGDRFGECLEVFFGGQRDESTLRLLGVGGVG